MTDDAIDWTRLREFSSVALTESYVLSWYLENDSLMLDLDLCLLPSHAFYESPRRAGTACIRPALLEFPACRSLSSGVQQRALHDAAASIGHGQISGLRLTAEGRYELSGAFGTAVIHAGRPILRLASEVS